MSKSILLVSNVLSHYRVPLFERLSNQYNLTVAHASQILPGTSFQQRQIQVHKYAGFEIHRDLPDFGEFDVVVVPFNLRMASIYGRLRARRRHRLLIFGIGVSASYARRYDRDKRLDFVRRWWINQSDGAVFYEHYPFVKYLSQGIDARKLFVAYNTIEPQDEFCFEQRTYERFVFIGTLYRQKKIFTLLEAYRLLFVRLGDETPSLDIIGDGEDRAEIVAWVAKNGLVDRVVLHGEISDSKTLALIMMRAIACISPGQAGLSVQTCFSFGVPFVTTRTAITGGELFSIIPEVNGYFFDGSVEGLVGVMSNLAAANSGIDEVARNALEFFERFRHPRIWVDGFCRAIEGG